MKFDIFLERFSVVQQIALAMSAGTMMFVLSLPFLSTESEKWVFTLLKEERDHAAERKMTRSEYISFMSGRQQGVISQMTREIAYEDVANPD